MDQRSRARAALIWAPKIALAGPLPIALTAHTGQSEAIHSPEECASTVGALFTLVGIAGEDDIDAPDLKAPVPPASAAAKPTPNRHGRLNGGQTIPGRGGSKVVSNPAKPILGTEASATLRDQLVGELKEIASSDDAAIWAHRILGAKNSLTEADARQVEDAFRAKLATLEDAIQRPTVITHAFSAPEIVLRARAAAPEGPPGQPCRWH